VLLVKGGTELHPESHWDVIQVHLVNDNEDKIASLLEKLKLLASIVSDSDVLFKVEYSEMSNLSRKPQEIVFVTKKIYVG